MKALLLILLLLGCESHKDIKKSSINKGKYSQEIDQLINETEELEDNLALDIVLRSATNRQRISVRAILFDIKSSLFVLNERPGDQAALESLFNLKIQLKNIPMQTRDQEFFNRYIEQLNQLLLEISKYQNTEISDLRWKLWSENFDNGLGKFESFGDDGKWRAGSFNRVGFVEANSSDTKKWLISPLIDLTQIVNPAIRIKHLLNIKKDPGSEINNRVINNEAVKVLISTNFNQGQPEQATWNELQIKDIPVITDFNPLWSELINLSSYSEHVISIAFVLENTKNREPLKWQIQEIELLGASSENEFIRERVDPTVYLFKHDFQAGMGAFKQETSGENPAEFELTTRNNETYLQISGKRNENNGVNYLNSPALELNNKSYSIKIKQTINFYSQTAQDKNYIQILLKHNGGEWQSLNFKQVPNGDNWSPVESEWLKLPVNSGVIELGFRYESGNGITEYPYWALYNISVRQND